MHMAETPKSQGAARVRKKTVFVVDDHPLLRQGLALLINREQDLMVCGEAEEAQSAMRAIAVKRPDILIADISLNGPDGLDLLKGLRTSYLDLPVLILSMHDESIYAERAAGPRQWLHYETGGYGEGAGRRPSHSQRRDLSQRSNGKISCCTATPAALRRI
jgi:CheY-like chemotaxis protein